MQAWEQWKKEHGLASSEPETKKQTKQTKESRSGGSNSAGSGDASSRWEQYKRENNLEERAKELDALDQERLRLERERMLREAEFEKAQQQLDANARTSKRSQIMLQGFHTDKVKQAASEAEMAWNQYERDAESLRRLGMNAGSESQYADYLDRVADAGARVQEKVDQYNETAKKDNPGLYYAQSMSREELKAKVQELRQKRDTARQVLDTTPWSDGMGGTANSKALSVDSRIKELNDELAVYEQALKQRGYWDNTAKYKEYVAAFTRDGQLTPEAQALAEQGKAAYERDNGGKRSTSPYAGYGYASMAPSYQTDLRLGSADDQERRSRQDTERPHYAKTYEERGVEDGHLSEAQKELYYALYARDPEIAREYLTLAQEQAENAHYQAISDFAGKNFLTQFYGMQGAAITGLMSGLDPYGDFGQALSKTSEAITRGGAKAWNEFSGTVDEDVPILGGKGLGDLYGLGVSMMESGIVAAASSAVGDYSAAAGKVAEFLGTILMGSAAAASDYRECMEAGLTKQQARVHATAAGIAEAAFEYISLDKLISQASKLGADAAWKDYIKEAIQNVFVQGGVEASEEFSTTVANRISDGILAQAGGYDTKLQRRERELVAMGMDRTDARKQAEQEWLTDLINDGIGGFLSGGIMSGSASFTELSDVRQEIKARDALRQLGDTDGDLLAQGSEGRPVTAPAETGERIATAPEAPRNDSEGNVGRPMTAPAENDRQIAGATEDEGRQSSVDMYRAAYQETFLQIAELAREMEDSDLAAFAETVEQNLEELRDSAETSEVARMEGQRDALRREINRREAVERNGARMEAAAREEVPGVDWNGNRETVDADSSAPLRSAQNDRIEAAGNRQQATEDAGREGRPMTAHTGTEERIAAAPAAPRNDNIEGGLNYGAGTESAADGGQRDAGLGSDRQAGGLGGRAEGPVSGGRGKTELAQLRNQIRALEAERRSAAQIGVSFGTKNENLRVVPEELYTSAMRAEQARAEESGVRLTFVAGGAIELRGKGGRIISADGLHQVDADGTAHIFARADSRRFSPEQLTRHEDFHNIVANNRGLLLDMVEALYEEQGEEGVARMVDAYVVALDGCYGVYTEGMAENAQQELARLYIEEIFADQYAGMNRSSGQARRATEIAGGVAQRFAGDIENARQNRAGIDRRNGPGTRVSIEADTEIEEKNITDGNAAVKSLIEQAKSSDNPESLVIENAMYRSDIGYIDLKWGTPGKGAKFKHGYGLAHIIAKRNAEGGNGEAVAYKLVEVIARATDGDQQSNDQTGPGDERIRLYYDGYTAVLVKKHEENKWLLTGWQNNETATSAVGEVRDSSNATTATPIQTRRNGDVTVSDNNIAHSSEESNTSEEKNPDAVDWEGNREQRLSVSDEDDRIDPSRYSGRDRVYMEAVKNGNTETQQRMVDDAAKQAGFTIKAWHGTPTKGIISFDAQKIGSNTDDGLYGRGFYFSTNKVTADQYAKADGETMPVYLKAQNPWWSVAYNDKAKVAEQLGMVENALTYSRSGISSKVVVPAGGQAAQFTSHLAERGYDSIVIQHGNNDYEVVVFDSEQVKSAEPVVRDDDGKVIPLSERFRTDRTGAEEWKNRDIRFSPSEDAGDSWGVDWIGKENGPEERGSTSSASRSEAPSPQGEGLETGERIAAVPEAPRNDSYAEQAREKKVEIARKASVDGLKSRIKTAEERMKALRAAERMGLVTEESKRQDLQLRLKDTQETLDILKAELDRKKAARSAQKADQEAKAAARTQRKAEKLEAQKAAELRDNRPRQARKEFRQDALNLFSVPAAKRQTLGDLLNRFADKVIHQGSVTEQDRRELFSSLYEAGVETIQGDEYYKQIRDFARGGRIYVPQELRSEFGDDWDAFRKQAWGNGIYLTNDSSDRGADAWNVELAEMFPGSFDAGETDGRRILEGIVELAQEGKAEHVSIEEMMLRNQQETGVSVDEQMDELERKVDRLIDTFAQKAELEVQLRKAGTMQLVKERQKNREIAARQAQRKKENDTRSQVMKQLQALNRMRKKSPPERQRQIDEIIGNLDVMARSISPEGLENLQELARKYAEAAEDPNFLGNPYVEQRLARLEKVQLDTKDISEVIELGRTVSALVKSVTEDKRLLTDAREREISDAAEAVNKEILSSEGSKGGKLREFLGNEHLSPTRMIQRLGGWVRGGVMEQLSRALEDGGTRRMDYQRQATRIFDRFVADKANQDWLRRAQGKDAEWIKVTVPAGITGKDVLSGKDGPLVWQNMTFEITPMMRVGLLMHSRNKDNLRHIKTGGIVIPNKAEYIKGNLAEADAKGTRVKLQPEIVRAIVKDCTAQERAFAALLEQYYDGFSKEKISEVSMQIDGFERAGGDHYYGIKVSRKFLAAQPEQVQKNMSLESIGSIVNERVHAGNPIILEDASAALTGHIDLISKYYGYTAPIRDFNAVMNYTFHQKATTEGGQEYTANAFAGSVKETLGEKWGAGAQKYLDDLLADLQQSSSINETAAQVMAKLRGNLAAASLTLNPAVALSQTASLPGAVQVLGMDGVIAGLKPQQVDMGLIEKYSPVLWYRNQGNSTQELGDYMATKGMGDRLPWWANWIQQMDSWTIRRLWAGAEYRVSKDTDLSPGSKAQIDAGEDAYYQEVAKVFQRAVYDTQPNYSEMQRPAILRSKSDLTKALTMYKTVPLQYYNMMYEAVGRLRADAARAKADPANKHYQAELQKSKAFLTKTFAGVLGANVTYVVMKALVKGLLGGKKDKYLDEEGRLDAGKIFGNLGKDLIDTYAGSVIFGSDLLTFGEKFVDAITTGKYSRYGGTEISFISAIEDVLGGIYDLATEIHNQDFRGGVGAIKDLAKQIAMVCGIPAQNVETYLRGLTKLVSPEWADRYDNLFDEIERGDLMGQTGRDLRAALRVLMDNRTDGLKDETVEELVRLWGNGQTVQVPSAVPASISIDGESHNLSADERSRFREIWGKTVSDSLEQLIESDSYEQADDAGKAQLIKKLYDYARQQVVEAAVGKEPDAWVLFGKACVAAGVGLEDYLAVATVGKDKLKAMDGTELDAAIAGRMQFRIGEMGADSLDELGRLYAAGATDVIPSDVPTSITVGGQEIKFSPEERVAWMQAWQRTAGESLEAVMASKAYAKADDAGKAKLISAVYDYARAAACSSVSASYAPDKWITIGREAESRGIDADEYIVFRQQSKDLKSAEKLDLLKQQSWTENQKEFIWMASMASEAQLTKYKPLQQSGVKWAAALDLMGVGEVSTTGMTDAEAARYQVAWDRISGPATRALMGNAAYKAADKATQSAYVDKLNAYVTQAAKAEVMQGYEIDKWVELGQKLNKAGVALDEYVIYAAGTSDARSREKYEALNKTGWTESQKLEAMVYISESTYRVATVGRSYQVGLSYYLDALAKADADQSGNINQGEAEDYIDRLNLGWEEKAYLWQMVCASSKWKNNPYSARLGEEIWRDLHPDK